MHSPLEARYRPSGHRRWTLSGARRFDVSVPNPSWTSFSRAASGLTWRITRIGQLVKRLVFLGSSLEFSMRPAGTPAMRTAVPQPPAAAAAARRSSTDAAPSNAQSSHRNPGILRRQMDWHNATCSRVMRTVGRDGPWRRRSRPQGRLQALWIGAHNRIVHLRGVGHRCQSIVIRMHLRQSLPLPLGRRNRTRKGAFADLLRACWARSRWRRS